MKNPTPDELQSLHDENVRLRHELARATAVNKTLSASTRTAPSLGPIGQRVETAPPLAVDEAMVNHYRSDQEYRKLHADFLASGENLAFFCKQQGLNYTTIRYGFSRRGLSVGAPCDKRIRFTPQQYASLYARWQASGQPSLLRWCAGENLNCG